MRDWSTDHLSEFETIIFEMQGRQNRSGLCKCGTDATWRCEQCLGMPETCRECCKRDHERQLFHRIVRWTNAGYYQRSSMEALGLMLHTGHGGQPCLYDGLDINHHPDTGSDRNHNSGENAQGTAMPGVPPHEEGWMLLPRLRFSLIIDYMCTEQHEEDWLDVNDHVDCNMEGIYCLK